MENYWILHSIVWNIFSTPLVFMFMIFAYTLWYNLVSRWLVGTDLNDMSESWSNYYNHQLHVDMLEERENTLFVGN